jgi:hypothetical protein
MKINIIDKADLAAILTDIFNSIGDSLEEHAGYEGTGRDEAAALNNVAHVIKHAIEIKWHVNDTLARRYAEAETSPGDPIVVAEPKELRYSHDNLENVGTKLHSIIVYKNAERWHADVHWSDGTRWICWAYNYKTRKSLLEHIDAMGYSESVEIRRVPAGKPGQ